MRPYQFYGDKIGCIIVANNRKEAADFYFESKGEKQPPSLIPIRKHEDLRVRKPGQNYQSLSELLDMEYARIELGGYSAENLIKNDKQKI